MYWFWQERVRPLFRRRKVQVALGIVALLVGVRAVLPIAVEHYVNKTLDELDGYSGSIEDGDLNLWRGAYEIEGVRIVKTGGKVPAPFFSANKLDISIEWGALLDRSIVAEIDDPKADVWSTIGWLLRKPSSKRSGAASKARSDSRAKSRKSATERAEVRNRCVRPGPQAQTLRVRPTSR